MNITTLDHEELIKLIIQAQALVRLMAPPQPSEFETDRNVLATAAWLHGDLMDRASALLTGVDPHDSLPE